VSTDAKKPSEYTSILVVGGGISGITTALEAAEVGREVFLVEKENYLGGRVSRMNLYFPKLCPPSCGLEINFRRIKENPKIRFFTRTTIQSIKGQAGDFEVTLKAEKKYINGNCTACGDCAKACDVDIPNEFDYSLGNTKAFYIPHFTAFPMKYSVNREALNDDQFAKCKEACKYDAIDSDPQEKTFTMKVGAIVIATGWRPYDAANIENLGFGKYANVVTNVQLERLAANNGPTKGKILRPSDNKTVKKVAFVQCAGSRDENHLPFCSGVCCLASLKQSTYFMENDPEVEVEMFYIDVRTLGRLEDFLNKVKGNEKFSLTKGKAAKIDETDKGDLTVTAEDVLGGAKIEKTFDMVVLATGMAPAGVDFKLPDDFGIDQYGFLAAGKEGGGIYSTGCAKHPADVSSCVQDSTAAAAKAMYLIK